MGRRSLQLLLLLLLLLLLPPLLLLLLLLLQLLEQIHRELLDENGPLLTAAWLQHSSTTYADDIHLREVMRTVQDLENMVHRFCILDALRAHGMVINSGKSAFLLRYRGSFI